MRGGVVAYTQGDGLHARGNDGSKCCPHNRFDSRPGFLLLEARMSADKRFFTHSEGGWTLHSTAEEAKAEAERLLDIERDFASREGEWREDVICIMWGEIHQRVNESCVNPRDNEWNIEMKLEDVGK